MQAQVLTAWKATSPFELSVHDEKARDEDIATWVDLFRTADFPKPEEGRITMYRGVAEPAFIRGLSWTPSKEQALHCATMHRPIVYDRGYLLTADVPREAVLLNLYRS